MATYVIGDIHGCLDQLEKLLKVLQAEGLGANDSLIFVGDYIDRGANTKGVIDFLLALKEQYDCVFLIGNHEEMFINWLGIKDLIGAGNGMWFIRNGGDKTLESYGLDWKNLPPVEPGKYLIPDEHIKFLNDLTVSVVEPGKDGHSNIIVHAGLSTWAYSIANPDEAVRASSLEDLLWIRSTNRYDNNFGTVIYGHTPHKSGVQWHMRENPNDPPYSVGIDTGCIFKLNPLVALRLEDWQIFSAGW